MSLVSSPTVPPPQTFSNLATIITSTQPNTTGIALFRNGLLQTYGRDYTRVNGLITFADLSQPVAGDILVARVYSIQTTVDGSSPRYGDRVIGQRYVAPVTFSTTEGTIAGDMDGVNTQFGIAFGPTIFGTLDGVNPTFTVGVPLRRARVYRNGQLMTLNSDCVTSGTVVRFLGAQVPIAGDFLLILGWI